MKVKDLIAALEKEDKEAEAYIQSGVWLLGISEIVNGDNLDENNKFIAIISDED